MTGEGFDLLSEESGLCDPRTVNLASSEQGMLPAVIMKRRTIALEPSFGYNLEFQVDRCSRISSSSDLEDPILLARPQFAAIWPDVVTTSGKPADRTRMSRGFDKCHTQEKEAKAFVPENPEFVKDHRIPSLST